MARIYELLLFYCLERGNPSLILHIPAYLVIFIFRIMLTIYFQIKNNKEQDYQDGQDRCSV